MSEAPRADLLVLISGGQRYAFPLAWVETVLATPAVTPMPGQPGGILGICRHRGAFLTLASLSAGREPEPITVICLRSGVRLAVCVSEVDGLAAGAEVVPPPGDGSWSGRLPVIGLVRTDPPAFLLDPAGLLAPEDDAPADGR